MMGYVMGTVFAAGGIAMFRKGGTMSYILGTIAFLAAIAFIGLSIMLDAKRNGAI